MGNSEPSRICRARERLAQPQVMSALRDPYERGALSLGTLVESARAGDKLAFQILVEAGSNIGKVVAIALNVLGPEMVMPGGLLAKDGDIILNAVRHQTRLRALQHVSEQVRIVYDDGDDMIGARGAALQALESLFGSSDSLAKVVERAVAGNPTEQALGRGHGASRS